MTYPDDFLTQEERDAIKSAMDEKESDTQATENEFNGLIDYEDEDINHE